MIGARQPMGVSMESVSILNRNGSFFVRCIARVSAELLGIDAPYSARRAASFYLVGLAGGTGVPALPMRFYPENLEPGLNGRAKLRALHAEPDGATAEHTDLAGHTQRGRAAGPGHHTGPSEDRNRRVDRPLKHRHRPLCRRRGLRHRQTGR